MPNRPITNGPSQHLSWLELSCWNHFSTAFGRFQPGELVAPYPQEWRKDRAVKLAATFEDIRQHLGNVPIEINSAFRTPSYNAKCGGAKSSQHVQGRAADIRHSRLSALDVFDAIRKLQQAGRLPLLGGLGSYATFVHIDVRAKVNGRLAVWAG